MAKQLPIYQVPPLATSVLAGLDMTPLVFIEPIIMLQFVPVTLPEPAVTHINMTWADIPVTLPPPAALTFAIDAPNVGFAHTINALTTYLEAMTQDANVSIGAVVGSDVTIGNVILTNGSTLTCRTDLNLSSPVVNHGDSDAFIIIEAGCHLSQKDTGVIDGPNIVTLHPGAVFAIIGHIDANTNPVIDLEVIGNIFLD